MHVSAIHVCVGVGAWVCVCVCGCVGMCVCVCGVFVCLCVQGRRSIGAAGAAAAGPIICSVWLVSC